MDSNHDIVPTLRMFDGVMMGKAADEIEFLRVRLKAVKTQVEAVRKFHFAHNPPNTGLASGFNSILGLLPDKTLLAEARAALAAPVVSEGFALVPIEPTDAMCKVGAHINSEWLNDNAPIGEQRFRDPAKAVYKAMIAAAKSGGTT